MIHTGLMRVSMWASAAHSHDAIVLRSMLDCDDDDDCLTCMTCVQLIAMAMMRMASMITHSSTTCRHSSGGSGSACRLCTRRSVTEEQLQLQGHT